MKHQKLIAHREASLGRRIWCVVRNGLPFPGRYKRYLATIVPSVGAVWLLAALYVLLAPESYASRTTLILPGSGVGATMNLESIGQASTVTASPFTNPSLSPTENYKRLLQSDVVLRRAAALTGEEGDAFPQPSIRLVDQTNLIEISITAPTPEQARRRGEALREAFLAELSELRADEADRRVEADRERLNDLENKVRDAQRAVLEFQGETGLVSIDQFNSRIAAFDALKVREREARTAMRRNQAVTSRLSASLDISRADARRAMLLRADPEFQSLLTRYANLTTQQAETGATLGSRHSAMEELGAETGSLRDALRQRGNALTGLGADAVMSFADLAVSDVRANLMQSTILADGEAAGDAAAVAEIRNQIGEQNAASGALVEQASRLADLTRDLRVAQAVFSSALAQLDTNQSNPFASYPLVQTLEEPSLPRDRASPHALLAFGGAFLASIFLLFGFALLWLRQPIIRKLLPNA